MNDLERIFLNHKGRMVFKWVNYFPVYERHLSQFRGKPIKLLEIGVYHGGSAQMWKEYFGEKASIIGVDIDERCKAFEESQITIELGDQGSPTFLQSLAVKHGPFDIVIDDGSHKFEDQINSFAYLWPAVAKGGVYICEDTHTSYMKEYQTTFPTYMHYALNSVNQLHTMFEGKEATFLTKTVSGIHFYNSMVVYEKNITRPYKQVLVGTPSYGEDFFKEYVEAHKPNLEDFK